MASYRADIEIAVKGAQELKRLQDQISATAKLSDSLNNYLENIGSGGVVRSIQNLTTTVNQAAAAFNSAALGTQEATIAARHYVTANKALNASLEERAALLEQINLEGQSSPVILSSPLRGRTESILKQRKGAKELAEVLADLEEQDRLLSNSKLDAKALAIQTALDAEAAAAEETAAQIKKLSDRQQEFTARTNAAAQAAAGQTAEFYRQKRIALQVARLNETAPKAQLLLNPAAPGSPAMSGGARRQITGPVERAGGMRTQDEADTTLRWAQATKQLIQPLSQADAVIRGIAIEAARVPPLLGLPSSQMLNASVRGIRQIETAEDKLNTERAESVTRLKELDRLEESRARRAKKLQGIADYNEPRQPVEDVAARKKARGQRAESIALGVGFPLMFGAGPGSVAGSLAGSFVGSGFGGQILGGAFGQVLDDAAKSAADFARSMREGGDAAGYLTEKLGYLNPETKALIQNAQQSGQTAVAAALAQKELANAIGGQAASDLKNYGELWDFTGRQFQKFTLLLQAGMPQIIAQTLAAATGLTGLYAIVSKLPLVAGLAGMVAPKEKPQTVEAQTRSKELQEQLTLARANYQVTLQNNTANSQGYLISKAQTIQTEKTVKYNEIMRDLELKKISEKDKILKVLALEVSTQEKLRNLEIERVQLIQQRNQVALAQAQAGMEVGIIQQQVRLAQEQNTASEVRRTSLQGQIGIQQALNRLESINLQIAQERANTQRDINNNKIKELEAQRSIATAQVDLAQAQAAQQQQQAARTAQADLLNTEKTRKTLILEFINLGYKEAELNKGELYTLKQRYDAMDKEAALRKHILNTERQLEILQRPDLELEINGIYVSRFAVLEKTLKIQKQITENELKQVAAQQQMAQYRIKREAETSIQGAQRQITKAEIGIQSFGMGEGQKAAIELENEQQQRRLDLLQAYTDKTKELRASIDSSTGDTLRIKQIELETEKQTYATRSAMLVQLEQLEKRQLVLNEITRTYGPIIQGVGDAVGSALTKGVQGLIEGTTTAQQVFADFLKSIGDILMQEGTKMIATYTAIAIAKSLAGLFSGGGSAIAGGGAFGGAASSSTFSAGTGTAFGGMSIPGFAEGGRPPVGKASLVGEQGPELFVPRTAGTIVPADATAAAMARYQRQGSGSGAGGSGSDAMGAGEATPVLSMSFETTRFLGQDYVSTDQLQAAMMATEKRAAAAGAKAGAAQVTSRLQQSPNYRRQVGLR